ncbi:chloramphenicol phosphotransferase CPT family protein [Cellulomonas sp. S1-8]|uniref:chloramphenicol phosphotransferase CPT family protein n=1 Tax=Cellulomonas sp. S1-8 TaxID=2904790 RepID=UPI002244E7BC|nr:chloramphenicol phosphotransferase [Cellulomonas sp. S1-8]UZN03785.1 chloramphenicol phosphotransferase CPT family protein [Cellulomonas sp. S1-8]
MTTDVVVLNGGSSSGTTTLARALQGMLDDAWLLLGVDDLVDALPQRGPGATATIAFPPDGSVVVGPTFMRVQEAWTAGLAAIARAGVGVLIDDVLLGGGASQERLAAALDGLDVLWVGVRCDADVAAAREAGRGDRVTGMAVAQADTVHRGVRYDVEVDTSRASPQDCARQILAVLARR